MNKYIGIFDSGVGGLTAVKEIMNSLPNENIIYFGDTKNLPYGDHTKEELNNLVINDIKLLNTYDIKAIGIACNTSDSVYTKTMDKYSKTPIIGIIKPTCLEAIKQTKNKRIGVLATTATINSNVYEKTILDVDSNIKVFNVACPKFVPLIEKGIDNNKEELLEAIKEYINPLIKSDVDTIILGCTHYPLLKDLIKEVTDINLVNSSKCLVNSLIDFLKNTNNLSDNKEREDLFLVSSDPKSFKDKATNIIGKEIKVEERSL